MRAVDGEQGKKRNECVGQGRRLNKEESGTERVRVFFVYDTKARGIPRRLGKRQLGTSSELGLEHKIKDKPTKKKG